MGRGGHIRAGSDDIMLPGWGAAVAQWLAQSLHVLRRQCGFSLGRDSAEVRGPSFCPFSAVWMTDVRVLFPLRTDHPSLKPTLWWKMGLHLFKPAAVVRLV